jgi:hypothetical protein
LSARHETGHPTHGFERPDGRVDATGKEFLGLFKEDFRFAGFHAKLRAAGIKMSAKKQSEVIFTRIGGRILASCPNLDNPEKKGLESPRIPLSPQLLPKTFLLGFTR